MNYTISLFHVVLHLRPINVSFLSARYVQI
jgi:hypothetical protein